MELNAMKEREAICDVCHKMWQRGIVAANDGNVSVKLEDGTFLCTPSGVSKAAMTPEDPGASCCGRKCDLCGRRLQTFFRNEDAFPVLCQNVRM